MEAAAARKPAASHPWRKAMPKRPLVLGQPPRRPSNEVEKQEQPAPAPGQRRCRICGEIGHRANNPRHAGDRRPAPALTDDPPPAVARVRLRLPVVDGMGRTRTSRTIAPARLSAEEREVARAIDGDRDFALAQRLRPRRRVDCKDGPRPCPWVSCRHHLYLEVEPSGGLKLNYPDLDPDQLAESCSLDLADRGGMTLEAVGEILRITRERTRQIETRGLDAARDASDGLGPMPEEPAGYEAAG